MTLDVTYGPHQSPHPPSIPLPGWSPVLPGSAHQMSKTTFPAQRGLRTCLRQVKMKPPSPQPPPAESPAAQDPLGAGRSPGWMANAGSECVRAGWGQRGREGPGIRGINPALPLVAVTDGTNQDDPMDLRGSLPADASRSTGIPPAGASDSTVPHSARLSLSSLIFRQFYAEGFSTSMGSHQGCSSRSFSKKNESLTASLSPGSSSEPSG